MRTTRKTQANLTGACKALRAALLDDLTLGRQLLANMEEQRAALISNDHRKVAAVEVEGQEIARQQEANNISRAAAIHDLVKACGMPYNERDPLPKLSDIALHLPMPEARALLALRSSILESERAIRDATDRNRTLVQSALDVVQFTFHALTDLALRPAGYGASVNRLSAPTFYLDHRA